MTAQPWSVEFYVDARGEAPARQFLQSLPRGESAVAVRVLELLTAHGTSLTMPHARPVEDLWELRAGPNRFFYVSRTGRRFIVLHGYRKQSQKAPRREIEIARRRLQDFLDTGG